MRCCTALIACLLLGGLSLPLPATAVTPAAQHRAAVEAARRGEYAAAVEGLRDLVREYPRRDLYLHDLAVVLSWAGREREAVGLLPRINPYEAPRYVVTTLARSAREAGLTGIALDFHRAWLLRWPDDQEARIGLALTLAAAGEYEAAREQLEVLLRAHPDNLEGWRARARVNLLAGDPLRAAAAWREVLRRRPDDADALRGLIGSLR
ncbi:MAG: hypothetical protein D6786_09595, partial [Gammaproteobacteria bacterium]